MLKQLCPDMLQRVKFICSSQLEADGTALMITLWSPLLIWDDSEKPLLYSVQQAHKHSEKGLL